MEQHVHVEDKHQDLNVSEDVLEKNIEVHKAYIKDAQDATNDEHNLNFLKALRLYPKAIGWSILLSTAIVMEGYDTLLMGSFYALPSFQRKYGVQLANGTFEIPAAWQAGLTNGTVCGSLIGLFSAGFMVDRIGYRKTMLIALAMLTSFIFIPFFAPTIQVLLAGQICTGIPLGVFQTITTAYAVEVVPTNLRAYLTTYVNLCWVFGQLTASGVLKGMVSRTDEWAYRIPFALQWMWPIPLMIGISFAPESPWWLVRKNRIDDAKAALGRLTSPGVEGFDADKAVALMILTTEHEKEMGTGTTYFDCFKGTDLRRTLIVCACYMIQILSGAGVRSYATYFYKQAGLSTDNSFTMAIAGYALGIVGVFAAWALIPRMGRRSLYIGGLACMATCLITIGGIGVKQSASPSQALSWTIGSILLLYTFFYDATVGPVAYSLVSETPSVRLRNKSIVLARVSYNCLNIVNNTITPYMLNPLAWNWGARCGFFFAGTATCSLIFTYFCVPEPKGRTFAEMDILFEKRVSARKFSSTKVQLADS